MSRANPRRSGQAGVTLIELMIAITLVAAISTGMLMAIRTSLITMEKTSDRLNWNRRVVSMEQLLNREIGGVMPELGECRYSTGAPPARIAAFYGTTDDLHLISSYSIAEGSRGYPQALELRVVSTPDGRGVRLVATESVYAGPSSTAASCMDLKYMPGQPTPQSTVIVDRMSAIRFSYRKTSTNAIEGGEWVDLWDRRDLPSVVRVEMSPWDQHEKQMTLIGVTIPIHINRQVGASYDTP